MKKSNKGLVTLIIILTILVIALSIYILYYKHFSINKDDVEYYIDAENIVINDKFRDISLKKIIFKNLDDSFTKTFLEKQDKLINKITSLEQEDFDFDGFGGMKYSANNDVWYQINNNILTVYYKVDSSKFDGILCYEDMITLNIDLNNNKKLSNEETLKLVGSSFEDIAIKEYNGTLDYINKGGKVFDYHYEDITEDFIKNKSVYIDKIVNGLDNAIYVYIQDGIVKYDVYGFAISILYQGIGEGGCFSVTTYEVGSLS